MLCFVGKDQNSLGFDRKTDVWGMWSKQMEQIRALAERPVWLRVKNRTTENTNSPNGHGNSAQRPVRFPTTSQNVGGAYMTDSDWRLEPQDSSYERQRPSSAGSARVQPDTSSGWNTTSRLCVIRPLLAKSWTDLWGLSGRAGIMTSRPHKEQCFHSSRLVFSLRTWRSALYLCVRRGHLGDALLDSHSISSVMSTRWTKSQPHYSRPVWRDSVLKHQRGHNCMNYCG